MNSSSQTSGTSGLSTATSLPRVRAAQQLLGCTVSPWSPSTSVTCHCALTGCKVFALDAAMPFDFETKASARLRAQTSLRIGIVGFGTFGQFLAKRLVQQGHKVGLGLCSTTCLQHVARLHQYVTCMCMTVLWNHCHLLCNIKPQGPGGKTVEHNTRLSATHLPLTVILSPSVAALTPSAVPPGQQASLCNAVSVLEAKRACRLYNKNTDKSSTWYWRL